MTLKVKDQQQDLEHFILIISWTIFINNLLLLLSLSQPVKYLTTLRNNKVNIFYNPSPPPPPPRPVPSEKPEHAS